MNNVLVWKLLLLPSLFVIISQSWKSYNNLQQMQIWILIQLKSNNFYIKWKWRNKHLSQKKSLVLFAIFLSPNITQKPDHHIVICLSCGLGVPSFLLFCVIYESSHLWVAAFTLPKCHKMTWDSKKLAKNFHFRGS